VRPLTLLALGLLDVAIFRGVLWLRVAVRVSSEIDPPVAAELAFVVGGLALLIGIPLAGWHVLVQTDEPGALPRARVIRPS
jgi:hypothetical protein